MTVPLKHYVYITNSVHEMRNIFVNVIHHWQKVIKSVFEYHENISFCFSQDIENTKIPTSLQGDISFNYHIRKYLLE